MEIEAGDPRAIGRRVEANKKVRLRLRLARLRKSHIPMDARDPCARIRTCSSTALVDLVDNGLGGLGQILEYRFEILAMGLESFFRVVLSEAAKKIEGRGMDHRCALVPFQWPGRTMPRKRYVITPLFW